MMYNYPFFSFPHFRRYPSYPNSLEVMPSYRRSVPNLNRNAYRPSRKNNGYSYGRNDSMVSLNATNEYNNTINKSSRKNSNEKECSNQTRSKKGFEGFSFLDNFLHQEDRGPDEAYFEIFGLKLYHDDLLLIGLIFFLYKEDVKDQYLFIALILLLLS